MKRLLFTMIGVATIGCAANTDPAVNSAVDPAQVVVESLYSSRQCGAADATSRATWVSSSAQLQQIMKGVKRRPFGSEPEVSLNVDFDRHIAVFIEMGQRPTLGYGLVLRDTTATVVQESAEITLEWMTPARGSMVGQMITSPCLLLKVERGNYRALWFKDTQGQRRVHVSRP